MNTDGFEGGDDRLDALIGRVIDGEGSAADWEALEARARDDASVWREFAAARRVQGELEREVRGQLARVGHVEAPAAGGAGVVGRVSAWGGWAVAAGVALMWALGVSAGPRIGVQRAALTPVVLPETSGEALARYVDLGKEEGRVVREMPDHLVLEARPVVGEGDSGIEVVYVRQIVERAVVDNLRSLGTPEFDEAGREVGARFVPVRMIERR